MQDAQVITRRYYSLMVLGILLPFLLTPFLSAIFLSTGQSFTYRIVFSRFLIWGVFGLMFLYARQAEAQKFLLWPEEPYKLSFYIISIVVLYVLVITAGIISNIPNWLGLHEKNVVLHKVQQTMQQYPVILLFTCFTAGVTEELIFRGYMISRLSLFFKNKWVPVAISAILFAAVHLGYKSLSELIFAFLLGLIFGYYYQKYRNIKILIIVHFFVDIIASLPKHHK